MPIYVQCTTFTEEGRKAIKDKVRGESKEVNAALEKMGIKILAQYSLLGHYDMINVLEAPNNEVMFGEAMAINHKNVVTTLTMPAVSIPDFKAILEKQ